MNYKKLVKEIREKLIITQVVSIVVSPLGVSFAQLIDGKLVYEPTTKIKRKIVESFLKRIILIWRE